MKKKILSTVIVIVVFTAVWNLGDYLYSSFISRAGYHFDVVLDIIVPIAVAGLFMLVLLPMYNRDIEKAYDKEKDFRKKRHHSAPKDEQ